MNNPIDALCVLRMKEKSFHLVLTDVHMPQMSVMSADTDKGLMLQGLKDGAAFFFVKPISPHNLSKIWQHAYSLTENSFTDNPLPPVDLTPAIPSQPNINTLTFHGQQEMMMQFNNSNNNNVLDNFVALLNEENNHASFLKNALKRPNLVRIGGKNNGSVTKKPKLVWTTSLHNIFLEAVNKIGLDTNRVEQGQCSTQVNNTFGDNYQMPRPLNNSVVLGDQIELIPNPNAMILDPFSSFGGYHQEFPSIMEQQQNQGDIGKLLSNNPRVLGLTNNYVGLRLSTNGELVGTLKNSSTKVYDNNYGGDNYMAKAINGISGLEKRNGNAQAKVNYHHEMNNFAYDDNNFVSFENSNNAPLLDDDFFGVDDMDDLYISNNVDQINANPQENSFGEMPSMYGIGDELRQLGIDFQDDQGITVNDDISFEYYFAQEYGQGFDQQAS
ncbi:Two-component response regulator ARR2 [Bienertia sinuspersici]